MKTCSKQIYTNHLQIGDRDFQMKKKCGKGWKYSLALKTVAREISAGTINTRSLKPWLDRQLFAAVMGNCGQW